jgi:hypothetical protein
MSVPKRDKVTGERRIRSEEHYGFYSLPNIIRVFESGRTSDMHKGEEKCIQDFLEEPWRRN